ncbi:hypothetical protein BU14_0483s0003 [Porphyra umbilicalis]|uniref:Uncharacterized protein n=1 Tax=Porphyra umbilicalis TaxID=2786 RepID=A0A1X6NU06_PORUM|nr:hypothetical protein BU14_0483s0003 [Porphyra umbilicalis]|eukprot:OSX71990.1 hypothetical protein BU14_0483s0003 [Porphyra umbilicalis]
MRRPPEVEAARWAPRRTWPVWVLSRVSLFFFLCQVLLCAPLGGEAGKRRVGQGRAVPSAMGPAALGGGGDTPAVLAEQDDGHPVP